MFNKIMTPVDLAHLTEQRAALEHAAALAKLYGATVVYVGVSTNIPSAMAHTPAEFKDKLNSFATEQAKLHGVTTEADAEFSHDPRTDLDDCLVEAAVKTNADMIVMQSHMPKALDFFWPSNGSKVAEHAKCSVTLVRS
ncbi:universal stress protein [Lentibacter sp. XHP0401]|uniref:universal stress protein n=1 Tax=Lentibacter sp. XHP0401 TaxID=2984334 RepID=UPI0021E9601C|nr:universal stress protein [Lentibacter sp. XHP0401]MCV2892214.1 universal stress protein [Lentibacter sp. XHP0401]